MDLKRYLSEDEARSLLAGFAGLVPGGQAAVYNLQGQRLAWVGPGAGFFLTPKAPPPAPLPAPILAWLARAGPFQPYLGEEMTSYPLYLDQDWLGCLVVREPGPAAEALQAGLLLLIKNGFEKRRLAGETLDRYREVNLLYHLAERFGRSLDAREILQIVLVEAKRVIPATCGVILLAEPAADPPEQKASFGPPADALAVSALLEELSRQSPPPSTYNILTGQGSAAGLVESVLYAPLLARDGFEGLLALGRSAGQPEFTAGEMKLLLALAGHTAIAVETARLHQHELLHQRTEQELKIGQRIQRSLLPPTMPTIPGWELAACYEAASQVGGDFYDIIPLPGEPNCQGGPWYGIIVADVTGKGIPAALMMAFSKGILYTSALATAALAQSGPAQMLSQANEAILQSSHSGLLVTVFYGMLDPCSGLLRYATAGHEPPIHYAAASGKLSNLNGGRGLIMGALAESLYTEAEIQIQPGDGLVFYTDGVTEARNPAGEFFAEEGLYEALSDLHNHSGAQILDGLRKTVSGFTHGAQQSDDITMVFLRRLE